MMESQCEVHSREPGGVMEVVQELVNGGNWEPIFNDDGVECTIVHTETPRSILFLDQEHMERIRAATRPYMVTKKHLFNLDFNFVLLKIGIPIWFNVNWLRIG